MVAVLFPEAGRIHLRELERGRHGKAHAGRGALDAFACRISNAGREDVLSASRVTVWAWR